MEYRADLYAAGDVYKDRERYYARNEVEAVDAARQLVVAHGLDHAVLYATDGNGHARRITKVGAEQ
ncbi:hypothetical protein ACFOOK_27980 [Micromonospora krabiensis]|nr:hypothetical protein [Micromonospora krabiensis]